MAHATPNCDGLRFAGILHVELSEVNAFVLQVFATACAANACPNFKALLQSFLYDKTADETAGSSNEYSHRFVSFFCKGTKKLRIKSEELRIIL